MNTLEIQQELDKSRNKNIIKKYFNNFKSILEEKGFFKKGVLTKGSDYSEDDLFYELIDDGIDLYLSRDLISHAVLNKLSKETNIFLRDIFLELAPEDDIFRFSVYRDYTGEKHTDYPDFFMQPDTENFGTVSNEILIQTDKCLEELRNEIYNLANRLFDFKEKIENTKNIKNNIKLV